MIVGTQSGKLLRRQKAMNNTTLELANVLVQMIDLRLYELSLLKDILDENRISTTDIDNSLGYLVRRYKKLSDRIEELDYRP